MSRKQVENSAPEKTAAHHRTQAAINPAILIDEMIDSVRRLRGVYEHETEALSQCDAKTFLSLQDQKLDAARDYQEKAHRIMARKNELKDIDPALKARLEETHADFSVLMGKNREALERMQRTNERLGNTIRSAAKKAMQRERAVSYGESGKMDTEKRKIISTGMIETA